MSKAEQVSVFNTETYKRKIKDSEYKKQYSRKNIIYENVSKGISKYTNLNTNKIVYKTAIIINKVKYVKPFDTIEEVIRYRMIHSKPFNLNSIMLLNTTKRMSKAVEKNICYNSTSKSYKTCMNIAGSNVSKNFKTLKEAQEFKASLIKKKDLIKKLKPQPAYHTKYMRQYKKQYKKDEYIEPNIIKTINTKTQTVRFIAKTQYKRKSISKSFKTLKEAQIFKTSVLEQISNLST